MNLKYSILCLTGLCAFFIVVEHLYQSFSYSGWNVPRSRLVASSHFRDVKEESKEDVLHMRKGSQSHRQKGGWIEEEDVDRQSNDKDETDNVWSNKRWKEWSMKHHGNSTNFVWERSDRVSRKSKRRNRERVWEDEGDDMDEEERLRISPFIYHEEEEEIRRLRTPIEGKEMKYISHFLPWELDDNRKHNEFKGCRYRKCAFINDMTQAEWVAIKAGTIRDHDILTFQRPEGQRWLMYTIDPAIRGYGLGKESIRSLFNATMTYNLDADVPQIFGRLRKVPLSEDTNYERIFDGKSKLAAWFVSHCVTQSLREQYVERMQTVMNVDVFGECGNMSCGGGEKSRSDDSRVCLPMLSSDYKFYLAFENAFCKDYVTEKFFKLFRGVQIIPVVRGGFQYKKYLPSEIFVNADDFESPEALSEYLIQLGNDKQRYTDMLRKKEEWILVPPRARHCLLCEYVHSNPAPKSYHNLQKKFGRNSCWYPKKL